jgi:hypothetical protein
MCFPSFALELGLLEHKEGMARRLETEHSPVPVDLPVPAATDLSGCPCHEAVGCAQEEWCCDPKKISLIFLGSQINQITRVLGCLQSNLLVGSLMVGSESITAALFKASGQVDASEEHEEHRRCAEAEKCDQDFHRD